MDYKRMKEAVDIVEYISRFTNLKQLPSGEFVGLCPLHHERTPSFFVNREKQNFCCMGCRAGGDIITFIREYHKVGFEEAVQILQYESGCEPQEVRVISDMAKKFKRVDKVEVQRVYLLENCMDEFPESHKIEEWIEEGISEEVLTKYNVRYNKEHNKILFPIWDENGKILAVKFRDLEKLPKYKYINKIGKKDFLYNMNFARECISQKDECILVESEKSVMKLETWGIHNSVAVGTHYIKEEEPLLLRTPFRDLVFAYDQDVPVDEVKRQTERLKHYRNIWVVPVDVLGEKEAPCDRGLEIWNNLYERRFRLY